jgi:DNA repair protein RadA/Sms
MLKFVSLKIEIGIYHMSKVKTAFFCQNCGTQAAKYLGKCPSCNEWNTFVEEVIQKTNTRPLTAIKKAHPQSIEELDAQTLPRLDIVDQELHRVLGGGLVPGSLILFGGEPGIGKSTLMIQLALRQLNFSVLYVSGEESADQIKMRAHRIGYSNPRCLVLMETSLENILHHLNEQQPQLAIIDSIQTLSAETIDSPPGSVSQVRECTSQLLKFAKESNTVIMLIGHITKEGTIAGPKVLEHMVDTVLQFEGDKQHIYRLLRTSKNRFGSTNELGIYEMRNNGLCEVNNPSDLFIHQQSAVLSGTAIAACTEGMRPMLLEIQSLVSTAVYGTPQRSTTGFDIRRLNMLLAVLEKRCGFRLAAKDVFLNIAGGMRIEDPAMDLAVVAAILSSNEDIALMSLTAFAGEVGLNGEIRPVPRTDSRIQEAKKLGFHQIFVSGYSKGLEDIKEGIKIIPVVAVEEMVSYLFHL